MIVYGLSAWLCMVDCMAWLGMLLPACLVTGCIFMAKKIYYWWKNCCWLLVAELVILGGKIVLLYWYSI